MRLRALYDEVAYVSAFVAVGLAFDAESFDFMPDDNHPKSDDNFALWRPENPS